MKAKPLFWIVFFTLYCLLCYCEKDTPTSPESQTKDVAWLSGWWNASFSNNNTELDIHYLKETSRLTFDDKPLNKYDGDNLVYTIESEKYTGIDVYGRSVDMSRTTSFCPESVPDTILYSGEIFYPSANVAESDVLINYRIQVNCQYDTIKKTYLTECSGNMDGHIKTSIGTMTFNGASNGDLHIIDDRVCCSERTDNYNFQIAGETYAVVKMTVVPIALYSGGKFLLDRESITINTEYQDGSKRISEIIITWQRDGKCNITEKTVTGHFSGSEIQNNKTSTIAGTIEVDCSGRHYLCDYHKLNYKEIFTKGSKLPQRIPFEVIFVDDFFLRWLWWEIE
ncbi:hypothetical protein JW935_20520 [candidate division KSB1 bacterium]|nr:hypothetical protein [candidate division KSB1 bacterium]